jgi:effector-binding domain-containing protein
MTQPGYRVAIEFVRPRPIAAVRARLRVERVPAEFTRYLDRVYALSRSGALALDGQNIFVYRAPTEGGTDVEVEFAVGTAARFAPAGEVRYSETPAGRAATTAHWGAYGRLGDAHAAVVDWCRANGHTLTGTRWEVYGHWNDDPARLRTDVYHLLAE